MQWRDRIKTFFLIALIDGKSRRKRNRLLYVLVVLTFVLFLIIHSIVGSLKESVQNIVYSPYGRVVSVEADYDDYENEMKQLKERYKNSEAIGQIFWHIHSRAAMWMDSELVGTNVQSISLVTAIEKIEKYVTEGNANPKQGEILVPKYLYDMGIYGSYNAADGSELLGKTICVELKSSNHIENRREYEFKVVGVYDNVRSSSGSGEFYINELDALAIDEYQNFRTDEDILIEMHSDPMIEKYPEEEYQAIYETMHWRPAIGFYVSPEYDLEDVMETLRTDLGKDVLEFCMPSKTIISYYDFIIFLGDIIVAMLGSTSVIVFIVTILRDLRERKGQFALRYACGYSKRMQLMSYVVEMSFLLGKAGVVGSMFTAIVLIAGNYIVQRIVVFYMRSTELVMHWNMVGVAMGTILGCCILCVVLAVPGIMKICPAETLKQEEGR